MSPPKEAESESVSSSRDSPPMEVGASASTEEEGGIVVEKGKDEEAKVLEPSDLEEEGVLLGMREVVIVGCLPLHWLTAGRR